ncbi:MAG TPA: phosphatase PAP2 family protein [Chloroflexota bacterium]|nr:phosphatase PAP2 family protein [Chloroflexota bacterium]
MKRSQVVTAAIGLYILIVLVASFHFNLSLTPDRLILLVAIAALGTGKARLFLKDWSLFLIVLLAWQVLTDMSRNIGHLKPHVTEMIVVDRALFFGHVPTIWLQSHFYNTHHIMWYDVAATILYMMHFVTPMLVAFALWYWKRPVFLEFMVAFLVLALAGFATFVLFPAAPPWIAANWWHYLPHVHRVYQRGAEFFGGTQSFSGLYSWMWKNVGWDPFGAVPSEHAAFPFLCFLYARLAWRRAGWILLPYCAAVWVAVVYMGEHYATDVLAGIVYASVTYVVVRHVLAARWRKTEEPEGVAHVPDTVPA